MNVAALVAEFIGTFTLIFVGVGAIAADHITHASGLTGIALAHGLAIAVMVSATGAISGGHLNPAVSLGALMGGRLKLPAMLAYMVAQCLGAMVAVLVLKQIISADLLTAIGMGSPALQNGISATQGILLEAVLTFFLVFVVFGTAMDKRAPKVGGLFIGLTVALDILIGGPFTGGAMNPARYLGPALMGGGLNEVAVYLIGPLVGGAVAGLVYYYLLEE